MKRQLTKAKNDGYRIVYLDETMFTRKTVADAEWSRPKENMAVDVKHLDEPTLALLCGISKEKGVEHFRVFENSVNIDKFIEYIDFLRATCPPTPPSGSRRRCVSAASGGSTAFRTSRFGILLNWRSAW